MSGGAERRGGADRSNVTIGDRFAPELALATEIAATAGRLLLDRLGRVERVSYKSAKDVVTEVDHLSEKLILDTLREAYPDDGVLAEESGIGGGRNGRVWVVDPLDGTINFANGIPIFCVAIALVVDGQPTVGVVRDPVRAETFAATIDGPATLDGQRIAISDKERLSDFVIALTIDGPRLSERLAAIRGEIRVTRRLGSSALTLAYVGNGRFDAFAQTQGLSAWDVAASGLIAERAGARVTDASTGGPWFDIERGTRTFGVVAAPPAHHARLLELIRPNI